MRKKIATEEEKNLIIEDLISYLKKSNIKLVYCPNEALGLSGPFMELENIDQVNYAIAYDKIKETNEVSEESELMISEASNG